MVAFKYYGNEIPLHSELYLHIKLQFKKDPVTYEGR